MRKIKEVLALYHEKGLNQSETSRALGLSRSCVQDCLYRFNKSGFSLQDLQELSEVELDKKFYPQKSNAREIKKPLPDWSHIASELKRKGVTLKLLWEDYLDVNPDGLRYSQFCDRFLTYRKKYNIEMRRQYKGGDFLFVDYSGDRPFWTDFQTGEKHYCELFVMSWGASNYTYAEAHENQKLHNWCMAHARAFQYFNCAPNQIIPDNLKSAVSTAHRYDPDVNPTYVDLCHYYDIALVPARPAKPRDKGKVENAVLQAQRWIVAKLRNEVFYSQDALNAKIRIYLDELNAREMKGYGNKSRKDLFEELDLPAAKALPSTPWEYKHWQKKKVALDYCVTVEGHHYSVPYNWCGKEVLVVISDRSIEIFHDSERLAIHPRSSVQGQYTILEEHRPEKHRQVLAWTPERLISWGSKTGPHTAEYIKGLIASKKRPEEGYRPALGIIRSIENVDIEVVEKASEIALKCRKFRVREYANLLKSPLVLKMLESEDELKHVVTHENLHGMTQYAEEN